MILRLRPFYIVPVPTILFIVAFLSSSSPSLSRMTFLVFECPLWIATHGVNYLSAEILGMMLKQRARPYLLSRHNLNQGGGQNNLSLISLNPVVVCSVLGFSLMMHPLLAEMRRECSLNVIRDGPPSIYASRSSINWFQGAADGIGAPVVRGGRKIRGSCMLVRTGLWQELPLVGCQ